MNKIHTLGIGVPTESDVKLLVDKFGVPQVGAVITYAEISMAITSPAGSSRFRTVTDAWRRKLMRENNILLGAIAGTGFKALNGSERVSFAVNRQRGGLRKVQRAARVAEYTDTKGLTDEEIRSRDHVSRVGSAIRLAAATEAKRLTF